jgi:thymidylate synthase
MENNLDKQYTELLQDILDNGVTKKNRTGTGTLSVFGRTIRHKMSEGFPILTTKKMPFKTIVTELLWFLRGDTNIKFLVDNNCHIWNGDCYKNYLNKNMFLPDPKWLKETEDDEYDLLDKEEFLDKIKTDDEFAKTWGELGPVYGKQWRDWGGKQVSVKDGNVVTTVNDQISSLINDLKTNPDSRRLIVTAWNPAELDQMVLPPCHYGFQVYTRELSREERKEILYGRFRKGPIIINGESYVECAPTDINFEFFNTPTRAISLMWNQRSVDTFLGLPFNIASYGLLLEIIAKAVNMIPDELIGNLGDTHLYLNHIEQAKEQIGGELSESERYIMFEDKGYEFRMNDWSREEQFDKAGIPKRTREPYPLPTLKHMKTEAFFKSLSENLSLLTHLDNTDFVVENYQSHPTIKAKLSN